MALNASITKLYEQIDTQTTILTPNRRLSSTLHNLYHQFQIEQEQSHWQTPDILPISTWIQRLWSDFTSQQFLALPQLLNSVQEQFLWEKILLSHPNNQLLQITETAQLTQSAWKLLKQWQVNLNHPIFFSSDDYKALHTWINEFQQRCKQSNWIDISSLPDLICHYLQSQQIKLPNKIKLIGFNDESPQLKYLLNCCAQSGIEVERFNFSEDLSKQQRINFIDQDTEIHTMARWAKSILSQNPQATIGCVIPTLDKVRDRIAQIFSDVFVEQVAIENEMIHFNISAGKSLLLCPIINTAMELLSLSQNNISIEKLSHLLTSPFIGGAETERFKRACFDSQLRKNNLTQINLFTNLQSQQPISISKTCPLLAKHLSEYFAATSNLDHLSYANWAMLFTELLTHLGWPGERSLNSDEYQIVENWLEVLNEFATLDYLSTTVNMNQALHHLQKLLAQTIFQKKTPTAPIQILGVLEAAALPFDHLWVSGMDDLNWPPKAKPHPLIPKRLQRELHMPHATSERELIYCKQLTEIFKHSAKNIIFSYAETQDDVELQASSLIREIELIDVSMLNLIPYLSPSEQIYTHKQIEHIIDDTAPPLSPNENIRGGISVLQQQALCPFKAFAEWRLHARELEKPLPGLRTKERGTILHKSIELLWNQLKNHDTLIATTPDELNQLIENSVSQALINFSFQYPPQSQYLLLEKNRLNKLLQDWLLIEKQRAPFKVLAHEKSTQITLNQLTLSIRIDRIDELIDGKKLIIDYKTGRHNDINHWFSDRPEQPQLPLYSLIDASNTIGIAFAQIFPGENYFKGISQYHLDIQGIKMITEISQSTTANWIEQLNEWRKILTKLSDDFYFGIAKVDPKVIPETCTWCGLKPLCRINEEICK